jgi:hypothetical protein
MKIGKLNTGYYQFGNKGAVWSNQTHIAENGMNETLCGTPMLSSNWAKIENHQTIGCEKCLKIYTTPTDEEWNIMMASIKNQIGKPVIIPERYVNHMIEHFTNCLPPIQFGNDYVLCSEPYNTDPETQTERYIGFYQYKQIYYGVITTSKVFNSLRGFWSPFK